MDIDPETKRFLPGNRANPSGKGGFGDHPEHRNDGRWRSEDSDSYWMNKFARMTVAELKEWDKRSDRDITVAQKRALERTKESLRDAAESKEAIPAHDMVLDRTVGKPRFTMDNNIGSQDGNSLELVIQSPDSEDDDDLEDDGAEESKAQMLRSTYTTGGTPLSSFYKEQTRQKTDRGGDNESS